MGHWRRETPWRQGHLLSQQAFQSLFTDAAGQGFDIAVVISHDCDLAQLPEAEPCAEVILGKRVEATDGNFTHAKNARRLHLPFTGGAASLSVEIRATQKTIIGKDVLADFEPESTALLSVDERSILQSWLSVRYRRAAFPDEFDQRLANAKIPKRLARILEPLGAIVSALYFDVDQGEEVTHVGEDDPYRLYISVLYVEDGLEESLNRAEAAVSEIRRLFQEKFYDTQNKSWKNIELDGCDVLSDQSMTVAQSKLFKRWHGDHISLRADPQQPVVDD